MTALPAHRALETLVVGGVDDIGPAAALVWPPVTAGALAARMALIRDRHSTLSSALALLEAQGLEGPGQPFPPIDRVVDRLPRGFRRWYRLRRIASKPRGADGFRRILDAVGQAHRMDVQVLVATGDGSEPFAIHRELELLVEAGLTPWEALAAATSVPADVLGRPHSGRLVAGNAADLIVVDGDPLAHIEDIRRVVTVVHGGTVYSAAELFTSAGYRP